MVQPDAPPAGATQVDEDAIKQGDEPYRALVACAGRLEIVALPGIPVVKRGDDLVELIVAGLARAGLALADGDVLAVTSKIVSRAEGRFVDLASVVPSDEARALADEIDKEPRLVELVLREAAAVSRKARHTLVVRHKLGFVSANAGIDLSNAAPADAPPGSGPFALLLPSAPDASAEALRAELAGRFRVSIGVVITDSFGRPFRHGTVGVAIGLAGMPALWDQRGGKDLFGRTLEHTMTALGDQVAAAADLVAGQANEGTPVVLVRGLSFSAGKYAASDLLRPAHKDLYA